MNWAVFIPIRKRTTFYNRPPHKEEEENPTIKIKFFNHSKLKTIRETPVTAKRIKMVSHILAVMMAGKAFDSLLVVALD